MNIKFIQSGAKKKLVKELNEQFGISKLPSWIFLETGKKKIRGFSGTMTKDEIKELTEIANVEFLGVYLIKREGQLRLSLDGSEILKEKIDKQIIELTELQKEDWFHGKNLDLILESGIYVIKFENDFLGCGISDGKKLINFMPKERRIRISNKN